MARNICNVTAVLLDCYSYITKTCKILIFVFGFAKMQPWKISADQATGSDTGKASHGMCAGVRETEVLRKLLMPGNR